MSDLSNNDLPRGSRALVILGMHRAGTSALSGTLSHLGADLPKTLMPPQEDNPLGFWEPRSVVRFNEGLLESAQRNWSDPKPIDREWFAATDRGLDSRDAAGLLREEYPSALLPLLKDPRISRLLPVWMPALRSVQMDPLFLFAVRNPIEIAASLAKRNGMVFGSALLLWLSYMVSAERATRGQPRTVVHYEDLLTDWRGTLSTAFDEIGCDALALSGPGADATDAFLTPKARHHGATVADLLRHPNVPRLVKDLYSNLFLGNSGGRWDPELWDAAQERLMQTWDLVSPGPNSFRPGNGRAPATSGSPAEAAKRDVIVHYHLFKNAGTSLDQIFKRNFPDAWKEKEGPGAGWRVPEIAQFIAENPGLKVLSSHTGMLPPPEVANTQIYPVIFLRHPLDRVRSIYDFEREQIAETEGARYAKEFDIVGYVEWRLCRRGDRAIRDFQLYRLAQAVPTGASEMERALAALDKLPFVGVVEHFSQSLERLQTWLQPAFPDLKLEPVKANVTQKEGESLEVRLAALRERLGAELYARLEDANRGDLELHRVACEKMTAQTRGGTEARDAPEGNQT